MNELYTALRDAGEFYAAELIVNTDRDPLYRYSRAAAAFFENAALPPYDGGRLYPCGPSLANNSRAAVKPDFSYTYSANLGRIAEKFPKRGTFLRRNFPKSRPSIPLIPSAVRDIRIPSSTTAASSRTV